ncbi:MAG TPA: transposase family protein [Anaerolineae bacterium]|nr:transposase family protein [Anaerolineae bacterium]
MTMQIRDDRQMRALTGVSLAQFEILLAMFTTIYQQMQWQAYQTGLAAGSRQRRPGGGKKGALPTTREKLLFVLYYFKVYPTFDVLGTQFGMARSKANENLHKLVPVLVQTLVALEVMPRREFATPAEMMQALADLDTILIDVTERQQRRPEDEQAQREHYSGKKTPHPEKHRDGRFG